MATEGEAKVGPRGRWGPGSGKPFAFWIEGSDLTGHLRLSFPGTDSEAKAMWVLIYWGGLSGDVSEMYLGSWRGGTREKKGVA